MFLAKRLRRLRWGRIRPEGGIGQWDVPGLQTDYPAGAILGAKGALAGLFVGCLQGAAAGQALKDAAIREEIVDNVQLDADLLGLDVNIVRASPERVLGSYR